MLMARKTDLPDIPPEQLRRNEYERVDVEDPQGRTQFGGRTLTHKAIRVTTQTPLDRYYKRGQIDEDQWKSGNKLFEDWYKSGLSPKLTADLMRTNVGECNYGMPSSERMAHHRREFREASAVVWNFCGAELFLVCCEQKTIGSDAGMAIFKRGLDVLARHYGFKKRVA